ncbi:MAG: sulfatase-like hydrolase/transferase [Halioglobus sp.]
MTNISAGFGERLKVASAALALLLTAFYFAPLNMLLLNAREIFTSPGSVLQVSWKIQASVAGTTLFFMFFMPERIYRVFACLLLCIAGLLYLQGNFFVWNYGLFDGTDIDFEAHNTIGFVEIAFWVCMPILAVRYQTLIWPHIHMIASGIVVLQATFLVFQLSGGKAFTSADEITTHTNLIRQKANGGLYDFSGRKNVLIIMSDTFSSPTFEKLIRRRPLVAERLSGFTNYGNTLGVSPFTLLSVPAVLSSKAYENADTIQSFMKDSFGEKSLPAVFKENGFNSNVITMGMYKRYMRWLPAQNTTSVLSGSEQDVQFRENLRVLDLALFRYSPHYLKREVYSEHRWLLQSTLLDAGQNAGSTVSWFGRATSMMTPTSVHLASKAIHKRFIEQASRASDKPTFKFIHLFTSHDPYLMGADGTTLSKKEYQSATLEQRALDQCEYALEQILEMLDALKALDIYDESLIVVAADHGSDITPGDSRPRFMIRSQPLLLIKPFSASGDLQHSISPASLLDIPLTVSDALGIDSSFSGYSITREKIPDSRVRNYYYFNWDNGFWTADHLPALEKYNVAGSVDDPMSWDKLCDLMYKESGEASC